MVYPKSMTVSLLMALWLDGFNIDALIGTLRQVEHSWVRYLRLPCWQDGNVEEARTLQCLGQRPGIIHPQMIARSDKRHPQARDQASRPRAAHSCAFDKRIGVTRVQVAIYMVNQVRNGNTQDPADS